MVYSNDYMLSSLRNKTSTRYEVSHFNTSLELQLDWHYDDLNHKQNLLSRNIHFTRDEQVYICFSDNDTVSPGFFSFLFFFFQTSLFHTQ